MTDDLPYQQHSETSRRAAKQAKAKAPTEREKVLAYFRKQGERGATDDECQQALGMDPSTQRPRRVELWRARLVVGTPVTRPTRSGRAAQVWVAK